MAYCYKLLDNLRREWLEAGSPAGTFISSAGVVVKNGVVVANAHLLEDSVAKADFKSCGWSSIDGEVFRSVATVQDSLKPGLYRLNVASDGTKMFIVQNFPSDSPISLPGLPIEYITNQIQKFWSRADTYTKYNFLHKRGIMLYGPPGCGKTSIIRILCDHIIQLGGIVFSVTDFNDSAQCIAHFRKCEPNRPIMTLMEDVERSFDEDNDSSQVQAALSFLDGQDQVNNIVHVATTNKPEKLAERFIKRPGRFDLVIGIHAPARETREAYLRHVCNNQIPEDKLLEMVDKTEGLGLSYLRELASTFLCLDIPLDETLARLKTNFQTKVLKNRQTAKVGFTIGYKETKE